MTTFSEAINELCTALSKAQAEMTGAKRDSANPFFKSSYADLASVRDACLGALNKHGLSVTQWPRLVSSGEGAWIVEVETVLTHSSGQFMRDTLAVPVTKADAQGVGSAITYARRYALGAVAGVAPADDDGEAAVGRANGHAKQAAPRLPEGFEDWLGDLTATADDGTEALKQAWTKSAPDYREAMKPALLEQLKARAKKADAETVKA